MFDAIDVTTELTFDVGISGEHVFTERSLKNI